MKLIFEVDNVFTRVHGGELPFHVRKELTFYTTQQQYMRFRSPNMPIKPISLYNRNRNVLFTGCLPLVLQKCNVPYQIKDIRKRPANLHEVKQTLPPDYLRDYQKEAFRAVLKYERAIIEHIPGSGKTFIIAALAGLPLRTLVLVPSIEILDQVVRRIEELNPDVCLNYMCGSRKRINDSATVWVSTYKTCYNRLVDGTLDPNQFDMVIVDETHHIGWRTTVFNVLLAVPAFFRVGLTGTATRESGDFLSTIAVLGPIVSQLKYSDAREHGFVADVKVFILQPKVPFGTYRHISAEDFYKLYEAAIVNNKLRNRAIAKVVAYCLQNQRTVLVTVRRIEHGYKLLDLIRQHSPFDDPSLIDFSHGEDRDRDLKRELLKEGAIRCLISTSIFEEGIDIEGIDAVINAAGEKSRRVTIQRVGRGIRKKSGDHPHDDVWVFDFMDNHHPSLARHSHRRIRQYKQQGFDVKIIQV